MHKAYRTIAGPGEEQIIERKSRFIGYACPVQSEAEAVDFINSIRSKHREATHNCYAYQIGEDNQIQRSSDDGEPSGTAGRPILEVIKKSQLQNTAVVVTRYFGGILLGAGGLVRAYSKAAQTAISAACMVEKAPAILHSLNLDYPLWGKVENYLANNNLKPDEIIYLEKVSVIIKLPQSEARTILADLNEIGSIQSIVLNDNCYIDIPIAKPL